MINNVKKQGYIIIKRSAYLTKEQGEDYNSERELINIIYKSDMKDGESRLFYTHIIIPIHADSIFELYPISLVYGDSYKVKSIILTEIFEMSIWNKRFIPKPILDVFYELQKRISTPNIIHIIPSVTKERNDLMIKTYISDLKKDNSRANGFTS